MKSHIHILPILFLVLLCVIMISGCSSNTSSSTVTIVPTITPQTGANPASAPSTVNQMSNAAATPTETQYLTYTNPTYPLTMTYPADWQVQEVDPVNCWALRDYGSTTCNVVNFFSPTTEFGTYHTFSIDVDSPTTLTIEDYFNKDSGALETFYPGLQVVKTFFQQKVSNNKAYELFFRKGDENNAPPAIEVVTITENNVPYIISYNALEDQEFDNMLKSIQIATVSSSTKQR
ncbi:hypothetical protein [Methanoregula sp.]|uniref:hypothetical protein n=1 Tax=Methanoregula sp. TaxID=2052170 RepID=UPI003BB1A186